MKKIKNKGFTLIEIMLGVSIAFILLVGVFFAYDKVQTKSATQKVQDDIFIAYDIFDKYSDPRSYGGYWNTPNNPNQESIQKSVDALFVLYINGLDLPESAKLEGTPNINYTNKYGGMTALNTTTMVIRDIPKSECPIILDKWKAYHGLPEIDDSKSSSRERCFDGYYVQGINKISIIFNFDNVSDYSVRS